MKLVFDNIDDKSTEEKSAPVGFVKNIPEFVQKLLDQYEKEGNLTWHESTIPSDEIWVKIGGDHGGGSFKLTLQIINTSTPNSKLKTCLLMMYNCKDRPENLRRLLRQYNDQIKRLQQMSWTGKEIHLFLCGDYDFY